MTELLQRAFAEASKLSDAEQDWLARVIMEAIDVERRWDALFATSQDVLARLADEALDEHRRGETEALDPDAL